MNALTTPIATKLTATTTPQVYEIDPGSSYLALTNTDGTDDVSISLNSARTVYQLAWAAVLGDVEAVTVTESLEDVSSPLITTKTAGIDAVSEVQHITVDAGGGTFTVTWSGQTTSALAYDIAAADLQTALIALSNIAPGDVVVTGGPGVSGGATPYILTWSNTLGNVAAPTTNAGSLTGWAGTAAVTTITAGVAASSEVQLIEFVANWGTFTITYDGQTTTAIPYNASAATVLAALEALSNIAPGDLTVTLYDAVAGQGVFLKAAGEPVIIDLEDVNTVKSISYVASANTPIVALQIL